MHWTGAPRIWSRVSTLSFRWSGARRDLHSFPTRRSSDLQAATEANWFAGSWHVEEHDVVLVDLRGTGEGNALDRSEEHTSELQSRLHLVCRLLLEKKN